MPASVRIELFPADLDKTIHFYTTVLRFKLLRREGNDYAYLNRDGIFIGCATSPPEGSIAVEAKYRSPPTGIEAIFEVDDLDAERDHVVQQGYPLQADIKLQAWNLRDFRVVDPDGYFLRITQHSRSKNGTGFVEGV